MSAALRKGDILCLMGDRLMDSETLRLPVSFLGGQALFPGSAYALASMTGAPVAVICSPRQGTSAIISRVYDVLEIPGALHKKPQGMAPFAERYAHALERFTQEYPYQFFNFHNLWIERP